MRFSLPNAPVSNKVAAEYIPVKVRIPSSAASAARVAEPRILPTHEKDFRSGLKGTSPRTETRVAFPIAAYPGLLAMESASVCSNRYARLAIWATFLLCALQLNASDTNSSCTVYTGDGSSNSAPVAAPNTPGSEPKTGNSGKYDVNRIGERNTGQGVNLYSLEKERSLGEAMAATIDRQTKFVSDPKIVDYVTGVAQKIVRNSDAQVAFTIKVIDSPGVNTFALPGGFLYVDKGLLTAVDNEAELAGLMAHEVAHVAARHATRYTTRKRAWNALSFPLIYVAGPGAIGARQIGPLALRKFSREAEIEADLLGIEYQYAAGYDPQAFVDALERLHNKEIQKHASTLANPANAGFFGHLPLHHQIAQSYALYPPIEERILKLQTEISTMLSCRDDYVSDTSEFQEIQARVAADRVVLRRHRAGDIRSNGPVLRRLPSPEEQVSPELHATGNSKANPGGF